jgi:hypothetical protein
VVLCVGKEIGRVEINLMFVWLWLGGTGRNDGLTKRFGAAVMIEVKRHIDQQILFAAKVREDVQLGSMSVEAPVQVDEAAVERRICGAVAVTCDPASGSMFALGDTTVACTATDAAGNIANGSFAVTVSDTTKPEIIGTPSDIDLEATGPDGAIATYIAPTASDAVDGAGLAVTCNPASGSTFKLDATTSITCSATDAAGNTGSSTFAVKVMDTTKPAIVVPAPITA